MVFFFFTSPCALSKGMTKGVTSHWSFLYVLLLVYLSPLHFHSHCTNRSSSIAVTLSTRPVFSFCRFPFTCAIRLHSTHNFLQFIGWLSLFTPPLWLFFTVTFSFSSWNNDFLLCYLLERQTERERKTEKASMHWFTPPDACNGCG